MSFNLSEATIYAKSSLDYFIVNDDRRYPYVYRNGVYLQYCRDLFDGAVKRILMEISSQGSEGSEVSQGSQLSEEEGKDRRELPSLKAITQTSKALLKDAPVVDESLLNADWDLVNFKNGLLYFNNGCNESCTESFTLHPHTPKVLSTRQLEASYDPEAVSPVFDRFLDDLTGGDKEKAQYILSFMGAVFSNVPVNALASVPSESLLSEPLASSGLKRGLLLYGPADTGKTIFRHVIEEILGVENYAISDLQTRGCPIAKLEKYFHGKRLLGCGDIIFWHPSTRLTRLFKESSSFIWFNTTADKTPVIPKLLKDDFATVYTPNTIPVEKRDVRLLDKMLKEKDGIVLKALKAFKAYSTRRN